MHTNSLPLFDRFPPLTNLPPKLACLVPGSAGGGGPGAGGGGVVEVGVVDLLGGQPGRHAVVGQRLQLAAGEVGPGHGPRHRPVSGGEGAGGLLAVVVVAVAGADVPRVGRGADPVVVEVAVLGDVGPAG